VATHGGSLRAFYSTAARRTASTPPPMETHRGINLIRVFTRYLGLLRPGLGPDDLRRLISLMGA
jgi:hypothetical protein